MQIKKILDVRRQDRFAEPVPDAYARARYFDYAINAPAWATLGEKRGTLWPRSKPWERNLRYFLAVIVMWYLVGLQFDKRSGARRVDNDRRGAWLGQVFAIICVLYGLFLCHLMLPEFVPLSDYGHWLPLRRYEPWFIAAVLTWGTGLVLAGSYSLFRRAKRTA
jgi:hypothetical protein